MFATNAALNLLASSPNWLGDGTFKVVPSMFYQLYVIHVQWKQSYKTVPVVFALMEGKSKEDYLSLFGFLMVNALFFTFLKVMF